MPSDYMVRKAWYKLHVLRKTQVKLERGENYPVKISKYGTVKTNSTSTPRNLSIQAASSRRKPVTLPKFNLPD